MSRIGIFLPHWLGDACMATPALRAISQHFRSQADCEIIAITRRPVAKLLEGSTWCDKNWLWEKSLGGQIDLARRMRRTEFDLLVLLPGSFRVGIMAWLGGARRRVGHSGNFRTALLTDCIEKSAQPLVCEFLDLARLIGCGQIDARTELTTTPIDESCAERIWNDLKLGPRVMGLNCGSAKSPSRRWPAARFADLGQRIAAELRHDVLVMCGPGEESLADEVTVLANHPRVTSIAHQRKDLGTTKACLRRLSLLVSTDSGPRHIASAMGTSVVSLHGPVAPAANANPLSHDLAIVSDLPCIGCRKDLCPLGHNNCMNDISVDQVLAAIRRSMARRAVA